MRVVVVPAHPDEESFNDAIARTACTSLIENGHEIVLHDLYREQFDPILPKTELASDARLDEQLQSYCDDIMHSDGIVLVHPNWWGQPPAILKGWIDRILRPGVAYRFLPGDSGEGIPVGLLEAHTAVVFNTSNTPAI